jgi:hypothetical protein
MKTTNGWRLALAGVAAMGCGEVSSGGATSDAVEIESASPEIAGVGGGTMITLTGTGFADAGENHVVIGGRAATDVANEGDTTLTFRVPAGARPGSFADVLVYNDHGLALAEDLIQYNALPVLLAVSISFDVADGGRTATITGSGFEAFDAGTNTVSFGAASAEATVVSNTELEVEVPTKAEADLPLEKLDVSVSNENGAATIHDAFSYLAPGLILATHGEQPALYYLDLETLDLRAFQHINVRGVQGMAFLDGELWALAGSCCSRPVSKLALASGTLTNGIIIDNRPRGLATADGLLYTGFGQNGGDGLMAIDPATGEVTGPLGSLEIRAVASRDEDTLYALDTLNGPLNVVDRLTGAPVSKPALMNGPSYSVYGAVLVDDVIYATARGNGWSALYRIDPDDGEVEWVKLLPFNTSSLAALPESL